MFSNKELSQKLKKNIPQTSFLDTLKISYRPYICPFDILLSNIPEKKSVYDIGCGSGMFLMLLAEYRRPVKLGGIEISEKLISNADSLLSSYKIPHQLSLYDGKKLPDEMKNYDIYLMIDVFHHIPKGFQRQFMQNLFEQMKPGSLLLFKDIDASRNVLVKFNKIHDLLLSGEVGNEISSEDAKALLKDSKFTIISEEHTIRFWYPHYLIICQK